MVPSKQWSVKSASTVVHVTKYSFAIHSVSTIHVVVLDLHVTSSTSLGWHGGCYQF